MAAIDATCDSQLRRDVPKPAMLSLQCNAASIVQQLRQIQSLVWIPGIGGAYEGLPGAAQPAARAARPSFLKRRISSPEMRFLAISSSISSTSLDASKASSQMIPAMGPR